MVMLSSLSVAWGDTLGPAGCMEHPRPSTSAGPASSSRMDAANALQVTAEAHVARWRSQHGMQSDADFGFAFAGYEEAVAAGGHHLAAAWVSVRSEQLDQLLPEAAELMESPAANVPRRAQTGAPRVPVKKWAMSKRRGLRLHPNPQETPAAIVQKVEVLGTQMMKFGALQPAGRMSTRLEEEWSRACNRLSQKLVTSAEPVTISNAIRTGQELLSFMDERSRCFPPEHVDFDAFLHTPAATPAPSRALASLKWISNQGHLQWDLTGLVAPKTTTARRRKVGQAVLVAPPMMIHLEERIEAMHGVGDPKWTAVLASWMSAAGCLRYRHLVRSYPRKLSKSTLHCTCSKGKQRHLRKGFSFCLPACFSTGWPWGQHWLAAYQRLTPEVQKKCGMNFDANGTSWHIKEITDSIRELFADQVEKPEDLSSYSWRRWAPSAAHLLKFDPQQLSALGDWQDKKEVPTQAAMALHYSGVRYIQSVKAKHAVLSTVPIFGGYEGWEVIPPSVVEEAQARSIVAVERAVHQDQQILWSMPLTASEIRDKFQLTTALRTRAAQARQQSSGTHVVRSMPAVLNGRTMSAFMKDGSPLCAAFQESRCGRDPAVCKGKHKCAAVMKSGRVCGGNHPGQECRDHRVVMQTGSSEGRSPIGGAAKPPEPEHPPKKKAKVTLPTLSPAASLATEEQELEDRYDQWATSRGRTAQRPSPIWRSLQGGTLWLGGIPTKETVARFPRATLQISCFHQAVPDKGGVYLPNSINMTVAPSSKKTRAGEWRLAWPVLKATLGSGEDALLHCVAGKHRAAGVAVLARSLLANESLEQAEKEISKVRTIDMPGLLKDYTVGPWLAEMKRTSHMTPPPPQIKGFMATQRSNVHLMTVEELPLCSHKQSAQRAQDRLAAPLTTEDDMEAAAWGRPICQVCLGKASAGAQLRLGSLR